MNEPLPPNPYEALGVAEDANDAAVRTAYRKLVLKSHPDKFPDPAVKAQKADEFHKIQQAYELLNDAEQLQDYRDRVKLAKLRAEVGRGAGIPGLRRAATEYYDSRGAPGSPRFEDRGNVRYEERVPKSARAFPSDDDRAPPPRPRFEERRASARPQYDDHYEAVPPLSSRKASFPSQHADEHRRRSDRDRWREVDEEEDRARRAKKAEKEATAARHADDRRRREKNRRQDYASKRSYNHARVEDLTESESSPDERYVRRSRTLPPRSLM